MPLTGAVHLHEGRIAASRQIITCGLVQHLGGAGGGETLLQS